MEKELVLLKGLHPGIFLANELRKRKIERGQFALRIAEYPKTIQFMGILGICVK